MYGVSAAFSAALLNSHRIATRVEVLVNKQPVTTLEVLEGQVRVDADQSTRRRCDIRLTDPTGVLTPGEATDLLTPYGNEIKLYRGIHASSLGAGVTDDELVPLGVFRVSQVEVDDSGEGLIIVITGFDRSRTVAKARFTDDYVIASGTNLGTAIQNIISAGMPGLVYRFAAISDVAQRTLIETASNRWEVAGTIADAVGCEVFFDADGACVLQPIPSPTTTNPVVSFVEGETSTLLYTQKTWDDEQIYNHVIVTGESTLNALPVRAEAQDDDPSSPTYIGTFGDVPIFFSSTLITSVTQAQTVANNRLAKVTGLAEQVFFDVIPHPALDVRDAVRITRAKSKIDSVYIVDSITIPLSTGFAMPSSARRQR